MSWGGVVLGLTLIGRFPRTTAQSRLPSLRHYKHRPESRTITKTAQPVPHRVIHHEQVVLGPVNHLFILSPTSGSDAAGTPDPRGWSRYIPAVSRCSAL